MENLSQESNKAVTNSSISIRNGRAMLHVQITPALFLSRDNVIIIQDWGGGLTQCQIIPGRLIHLPLTK